MFSWTSFEKHWRTELLYAMIPMSELEDSQDWPGKAAFQEEDFWQLYQKSAPFLLRFGLRFSVWLFTWLPLFSFGIHTRFHKCDPAKRDKFLQKAINSRFFVLRQCILALKVVASMAYLRNPEARAALELSSSK